MSSEGENAKDLSTEGNKATGVVSTEDNTSEDSQETKPPVNNEGNEKNEPEAKSSTLADKPSDSGDKKDKKEQETKKENDKTENHDDATDGRDTKEKKNESNVSKTDNNDTEEGEESEKDGEEDEEEEEEEEDDAGKRKDQKKNVPLLDQPLEQPGTRERKKVQRFNEDFPSETKETKTSIPAGTGSQLGEIPRIDASISRFKNDDLKLLHRLLYKTPGKTALITKNIKKFNGFDFKKDSEEYNKKIDSTKKFELKQLKSICEMLDLEKKGTKDEIVDRIIEFLMEPKDSGKQVGGGRPKRTAAVRANNRGYSSHDDSYSSDERRASRGSGRGKGKRTNLKDESTSESDAEFHPSDASESRPRVVKRTRGGRKKADSEEEEVSDVDSATSEESDDEPRKRKKNKKPVIAANNKVKGKVAPRTRGRKPVAETEKKTTTMTKRGARKRDRGSSEESEQQEDDNLSSSEDEPLIKKAKSPLPPTDEEIKKYVKEILDGANLEEITMKTVCKQVYAHYPDFDLAHKKDFIKSTVKSLIST